MLYIVFTELKFSQIFHSLKLQESVSYKDTPACLILNYSPNLERHSLVFSAGFSRKSLITQGNKCRKQEKKFYDETKTNGSRLSIPNKKLSTIQINYIGKLGFLV